MARDAIDHIHHVGLVVSDMRQGLDLFRRLGFNMTKPTFPALPRKGGGTAEPVGAGNSHATFVRNFIELAMIVKDRSSAEIPEGADIVPLQVPAERLPAFTAILEKTVGKLAACLERFVGLHILVFHTPDIDATAARLREDGVVHSGVQAAQRKIHTRSGIEVASVRFLEIEGPPEERIAVADNPTMELLAQQDDMDHPNGAVDLVESVLCVAAGDVADVAARYEKYLARAPRADDGKRIFDLDRATVTIIPDSMLDAILPGERAPALPAFVAYAVAVRDLAATRKLLEKNGFPLRTSRSGHPFVPAADALGAAVIFRQAT